MEQNKTFLKKLIENNNMFLKTYFHTLLVMIVGIFLAILLFGIAKNTFFGAVSDILSIIGVSILAALRKVIANCGNTELCKLCFIFGFFDWMLYIHNIQFEFNVNNPFKLIRLKFKH